MPVTERTFRPTLNPGRNQRGRRDVPTPQLDEFESAASEAAQEILPRIEEMIRDRLRHVTENIPEGDEQEVILTSHPTPPFFGVTTRRVKE